MNPKKWSEFTNNSSTQWILNSRDQEKDRYQDNTSCCNNPKCQWLNPVKVYLMSDLFFKEKSPVVCNHARQALLGL